MEETCSCGASISFSRARSRYFDADRSTPHRCAAWDDFDRWRAGFKDPFLQAIEKEGRDLEAAKPHVCDERCTEREDRNRRRADHPVPRPLPKPRTAQPAPLVEVHSA